jgi:hypothetical protein
MFKKFFSSQSQSQAQYEARQAQIAAVRAAGPRLPKAA